MHINEEDDVMSACKVFQSDGAMKTSIMGTEDKDRMADVIT